MWGCPDEDETVLDFGPSQSDGIDRTASGRRRAESTTRATRDGVFDPYDELALVRSPRGGTLAAMVERTDLHAELARLPEAETMESSEEFDARLEDWLYVDTCGGFGCTVPIRIVLQGCPGETPSPGPVHPCELRSSEERLGHTGTVEESCTRGVPKRVLGENALDGLDNRQPVE